MALLSGIFLNPNGLGKKSHWKMVMHYEGGSKACLKMAFKLSEAHINPKGFQKMNVPLAYQVKFLVNFFYPIKNI